jgi:hypothetical protein
MNVPVVGMYSGLSDLDDVYVPTTCQDLYGEPNSKTVAISLSIPCGPCNGKTHDNIFGGGGDDDTYDDDLYYSTEVPTDLNSGPAPELSSFLNNRQRRYLQEQQQQQQPQDQEQQQQQQQQQVAQISPDALISAKVSLELSLEGDGYTPVSGCIRRPGSNWLFLSMSILMSTWIVLLS